MERVQRMKTATCPQEPLASFNRVSVIGRPKPNSLAALTAAAIVTFGIGLSMPFTAAAQEPASRTIATGTGIPLTADAPDRYTVKTGDTLWDIAKVFLRDPWYWPEIWYVNPQVKNPHLIYPGDVLALVSLDGRPQVSVAERGPEGTAAEADSAGPMRSGSGTRLSPRVRSQPITAAVTAIPYGVIAAFMGRPTLLTKEQVKSAPYIVGLRDAHLIGGEENDLYARGIEDAQEGARYNMIHVDEPLRDPQSGKVLGYRGLFVGLGTVSAPGKIAKLRANMTQREVLQGDKLFTEDVAIALDFIPHPVDENVSGAIMAVDGITQAGKYSVVALNRGTRQGLEVGHVLAISQKGEAVSDRYKNGGKGSYWSMKRKVRLPNERVGLLMVFKTYERMSYALIMETTHAVRVGDLVGAP